MTVVLPTSARYVPYHQVGEQPHAIVDGAPLASTVLTLSHWPNSQTHPSLRRDTSTEIVFAYLDTPELHQDVSIVSNNHFDEDGLFSMFGLTSPAVALEHRDLLTGGALAGDFGVYEDPQAVRLCFIIEAFCDPNESPLSADTFTGCERVRVEALYRAMLERVPALAGDVNAWESLWRGQYEHLEESVALIESGAVSIEEYPDVDLAVVSIPTDVPDRTVYRYLESEQAAIHPFAINSRTLCNRVLRITGRRYELQYRYESWLQLASRRPPCRVALDELVTALDGMEQAAGEWRCDDPNGIVPRLWLDGTEKSSLAPERFVDEVRRHLATAPVAWDPYDWDAAT